MIEINGVGIERFINTLHAQNVALFEMQRPNRTTVCACAYAHDQKRIRQLAEDSRCRVTFRRQKGLPRAAAALGKRWLFLAGAILFAAAAFVSTRFVWYVGITGVEDAAHIAEMYEQIVDMGYGPGTRWDAIDTNELKRQLMLRNNWIAYVLTNRIGARLEIEVVPENPKPDLIDKDTPCDIVATKEAVIHTVTALDGLPQVEVGEVVHPGDVLVLGAFPRDDGQPRLVTARGTVQGRVVYQGMATAATQATVTERTGRTGTARTLYMCGYPIELDAMPFAEYDILETEKIQVSHSFLPAYIERWTVAETQMVTVDLTYETMYQNALKEAEKKAQAQIPEGVAVDKKTVVAETSETGEVTVKVFLETIEDIGTPRYYVLEDTVEGERNDNADAHQDAGIGDGARALR